MHNLIIIITNRAEAEKIVSAMSPEKVKLQQQLVKNISTFETAIEIIQNLIFWFLRSLCKIKKAHELVGMSVLLKRLMFKGNDGSGEGGRGEGGEGEELGRN